jgi:uncharacterized FlaG/YvyC family protein
MMKRAGIFLLVLAVGYGAYILVDRWDLADLARIADSDARRSSEGLPLLPDGTPQIAKSDILKPSEYYRPQPMTREKAAQDAKKIPSKEVQQTLAELPKLMKEAEKSLPEAHKTIRQLRVCLLDKQSSMGLKQICMNNAVKLVRRHRKLRPELDILLPAIPPQVISQSGYNR